jgi:hypothetical protein
MARKRHLVDDDAGSAAGDVEADENDVATWPEVENAASLDGGECVVSQQRPPELLAELQETLSGNKYRCRRRGVSAAAGCRQGTWTHSDHGDFRHQMDDVETGRFRSVSELDLIGMTAVGFHVRINRLTVSLF